MQAAEGAAAEFEAAVVGFGEVGGDGDAKAVAGGALVEAFAAAGDAGDLFVGEAGAVVFDGDLDVAAFGIGKVARFGADAAGRPFARVVEQVAEHFFEVGLFGAQVQVAVGVQLPVKVARGVQAAHEGGELGEACREVDAAHVARAAARAGQVALDEAVHVGDLLAGVFVVRFAAEQGEWFFQGVAEVGGVAAGTGDDARVALQHVVDFARQRVEVGAVAGADAGLFAAVDGTQGVVQAAQRGEAEVDL